MNRKEIRITCAQIHTETNQKERNIEKMKAFADKALAQYPDTDILLFPELALTGCECDQKTSRAIAEPLTGPSIQEMAQYAAEKKVFLVFGFIEQDTTSDKIFNSAVLINAKGEILGQYRKMHLVEEEKVLVDPGDSDYPVFDTEIGKIGIMICWDSAFPEVARILSVKGADYILIPAAWESPMQKDWDLVQKARAFDNVIFTACCNQVGGEKILDFFGKSKVLGPTGEILSEEVENQEAIVSASFRPNDKNALRDGYYALLRDRRPNTYSALTHSFQERT